MKHQRNVMPVKFVSVLVLMLIALALPATAQTLKVMTYNIRYDTPSDGVNAWPNRKDKVVDLIKKYDPDLIGIQEALHHQLEALLRSLPQYKMIGVGRDDGKTLGEFSAILYKHSMVELRADTTFWLSETPQVPGSKSWDAAITRIVTWGTFADKSTQRTFAFFNTHFDHIGAEARAQSAVILKSKVSALNAEYPVIVTGDFNCTPDEKPYSILTDASSFELIDPSPQPEGTFCSFTVGSIECKRIDYIFITNEWRADSYHAIQDNDGTYYPSDHLPVIVTLSLTE